MTPFERLVRARPESYALRQHRREGRSIDVALESEREAVAENPDEATSWSLGGELARSADLVRCIARWDNRYVGDGTVILDVRIGPLRPGDSVEGTSELGPILRQEEYFYGADLVAVGFTTRLSWPVACVVYGAARETLVAIHHQNGRIHGNLKPARIRFNLLQRDNDFDPFGDVATPFYFLDGIYDARGNDDTRARELSVLAFAIAALTAHEDPTIDRLLRDPSSRDVLRDLLLEHGEPVEALLRDAALVSELAEREPDDDAIDGALRGLWDLVIRLERMIDSTDPAVFFLPRTGKG